MSNDAKPKNLLDKLWDSHLVQSDGEDADLLYIDLHLVQEVSSPQAFAALRDARRPVRRPDLTLATVDHAIPTTDRLIPVADTQARLQIEALEDNCAFFKIPIFDSASASQGIVHVIGPEQGLTQPGMTIVCGDSHTTTHGAFGALAFGIGSSQVEHVLATQCLPFRKPRSLAIRIDGTLGLGVTAKDVALGIIARRGAASATGYAVEYLGSAVEAMSMEARMTLCNMSIELGGRVGMVAPDETTYEYLRDRPYVTNSAASFDELVAVWSQFESEAGAQFDDVWVFDAAEFEPMVTWGTTPAMAIPVSGTVPAPEQTADPDGTQRAFEYMNVQAGQTPADFAIDRVFIGSCTNARIEDLRAAASVVDGRQVADGVRAMVVPGSSSVRRQAESEGLADVFRAAGFEWREAGCSMCVAMNGDMLAPGERCASTSNRNFEGRQGPGGRTHLVSPAMAAAAALYGHFVDVRALAP